MLTIFWTIVVLAVVVGLVALMVQASFRAGHSLDPPRRPFLRR
jgi:hypothetical protein